MHVAQFYRADPAFITYANAQVTIAGRIHSSTCKMPAKITLFEKNELLQNAIRYKRVAGQQVCAKWSILIY